MKFAVLASGYGSNLQAIIQAVQQGTIAAKLALVISDREAAYALKRAQQADIKNAFINPSKFSNREGFDRAVIQHLQKNQIDFVVLAGFMRLLSSHFIQTYRNKILNIHPSLLPDFKGTKAIQDAFDAGVKTTGVTIHFVDEEMDHGPVIRQEKIAIQEEDTVEILEERIHQLEHRMYPQVIDWFARGKITVDAKNSVAVDLP